MIALKKGSKLDNTIICYVLGTLSTHNSIWGWSILAGSPLVICALLLHDFVGSFFGAFYAGYRERGEMAFKVNGDQKSRFIAVAGWERGRWGAGIAFLSTIWITLLPVYLTFYHYAAGEIWGTKLHTSAAPQP